MERKSNSFVPTSSEELFSYYFDGANSLAANTIRKIMRHATPDEVETLTHDAFVRFLEHGMMEKFDAKKGNFGGLVYVTARTVATHHLSKKSRNPITGLHGGSIRTTSKEFEKGVYAEDRFQVQPTTNEGPVDDRISYLLAYTEALATEPHSKRDRSLKTVVRMMLDGSDLDEIAQACGVATSTVHGWCAYLRTQAA